MPACPRPELPTTRGRPRPLRMGRNASVRRRCRCCWCIARGISLSAPICCGEVVVALARHLGNVQHVVAANFAQTLLVFVREGLDELLVQVGLGLFASVADGEIAKAILDN